jgi:hypothetical protein
MPSRRRTLIGSSFSLDAEAYDVRVGCDEQRASYGPGMVLLRLALAAFVLAWVFDLVGSRSVVPLWLPFSIAVGLEFQLFLNGLRAAPARSASRGRLPSDLDRERYGCGSDAEELLLVRDRNRELWIPYSGEGADEVD